MNAVNTAGGGGTAGAMGARTVLRQRCRAVLRSPRARAGLNAVAGIAILAGIVAIAGGEPFIRGLTSVTPGAIAAAASLTAIATWAAAWRWRLVSAGLGVPLGPGSAFASYYRSQFLNSVLPGGVMGDVHRAFAHGIEEARIPDASRAVVSERAAGQAVQLVLAAVVLAGLGVTAYSSAVDGVLLALLVGCAAVGLVLALSRRVRRLVARELSRARAAFAPRCTVVRVVVASALVVSCHVATFVVACFAVGIEASPERVVAVSIVVVLAASLPLAVGGWGPREGAAAWAFGVVGLGAADGIAASTAYGVLAMIALTPGAVVIGASALRHRRALASPDPVTLASREEPTI